MNIIIILTSFALVLLLSRIKIPLSACLLIGAAVLGVWSGLPFADLIRTAGGSLYNWTTVYLIATIVLILFLSRLMESSGHLQRIVYSFILLVRDRRAVSALVPALIGLLPMPGGALFSAPLVKKAVGEGRIPADLKAMINYWFRHVWEYWWPLYPGFILAVGLLGVPAWKVMVIQFPLALICAVVGIFFLLIPLKGLDKRKGPATRTESFISLLKETSPILAVVGVIVVLNLFQRILEETGHPIPLPPEFAVLAGIGVCILMVIQTNRLGWEEIKGALKDRKYFTFVFLVLAIMVFKGVLTGSSIVDGIKDELVAHQIPVVLVVAILPFISGLVTGITVGTVGASFPVIIPLISGQAPLSYLALAALAYGFGYMGVMLSPVHLCLLVSKDYFKARFTGSYRLLFKLTISVLLLTALYVLLLMRIG